MASSRRKGTPLLGHDAKTVAVVFAGGAAGTLARAALASVGSALLFLGGWVVAGQRLYPLPLRWRALGACTLAALPLGAAGPAFDAAFAGLLAGALKLALLGGVAAICVASGLLRPRAWRLAEAGG